jgi:hypothetical protein
MSDAVNWLRDPQVLAAGALWALVALAAYCAVCESINTLRTHGIRRDLTEQAEWIDGQITAIHTRLDRLGAPGIHPNSDPPPADTQIEAADIVTGEVLSPLSAPVPVPEAVKATDQAVEDLKRSTALLRPGRTDTTMVPAQPQPELPPVVHREVPLDEEPDKPRPWQNTDTATRPDFTRLRQVPGPDTDPLLPVFTQPGQPTPPQPRQQRTGGRHRADG